MLRYSNDILNIAIVNSQLLSSINTSKSSYKLCEKFKVLRKFCDLLRKWGRQIYGCQNKYIFELASNYTCQSFFFI